MIVAIPSSFRIRVTPFLVDILGQFESFHYGGDCRDDFEKGEHYDVCNELKGL